MASTLTAKFIIDQVNEIILNEEFEQFTEADMIAKFNMTTRKIIQLVPSAYTIMSIFQLDPGVRQDLPSVGIELLDVMCNCSDATTETTPIYKTDLEVIDNLVPGWRSVSQATSHDNWMKEPDVPNKFFVSPPSDGTNYIKAKMSATPPGIVYDAAGNWESEVIPLDDRFSNAYISGMIWKCYNEDSDIPGNLERSEMAYQKLLADLGFNAENTNKRKANRHNKE